MTYQQAGNTARYEEKKTWPDRYYVEKLDQTVTIIDGKVTIVLPHLELVIIAPVKGTKGSGVADADKLAEPNPTHVEILQVLSTMNDGQKISVEYIMDRIDGLRAIKKGVFLNQMLKGDLINRNAWRRPVSELVRKGAINYVKDGPGTHSYQVNLGRVNEILEKRSF